MLIEIRIGPGKRKITNWISNFCDKCRIPDSKVHRVPHISLYGTFSADRGQVERVKSLLTTICRKYSYLPFTIDDLQSIKGEKGFVIYFNIIPSDALKQFRDELAANLFSIVPDTKPFDYDKNFLFHSTLAYKLSDSDFNRISKFLNSGDSGSDGFIMPYFYLPMAALRITFLNNQSRIICEYDLLQHRLLPRLNALNKTEWQRTSRFFRIQKGMEGYHEQTDSVYLTSDLHLDHANIIRYCARPFLSSNVDEMNSVLVENWNNVVHDSNTVYFLGDLTFGRRARPAEYWLPKLNGTIHYIRGNHEGNVRNSQDYAVITHRGFQFLLIHNPDRKQLPIPWDGWVIHGHKHDNDMKEYPFINGERKTINVSAELTNYRPVSLDYILSLNPDTIKRMDTIDSIPLRN
ncbi:MAG TPA: 2'-5' RNA ligase family protein [Methanoregulaceae archaeon]|nr:2'-5' RNA ligase family protein [Methanoregulaceae archaeon]